MAYETLFSPFSLKSLHLKNRFVMAPMTRTFSPDGVPTPEVAAYYRRRAEGEVGLILTEGTVVNREASANHPKIPHFYGHNALEGWKEVVSEVHAEGGKIAPQIWHVGVQTPDPSSPVSPSAYEGPSGLLATGEQNGKTMTEEDIADTISAFARSAAYAKDLGFDTLELHGAHGYLIDQFFWDHTNKRTDRYGGATIGERTRFGVEVVQAVRKAVGEDFPIILRLSQWKLANYENKIAKDPAELEAWLNPLSDAGVDLFHCSQRRFWEPEYEGSDLNFAGWAKKVTGKPTITVGSIGLSGDVVSAFQGEASQPSSIDELERRLERQEFDLVAVGRALLSDPAWVAKIHHGKEQELVGFSSAAMASLI